MQSGRGSEWDTRGLTINGGLRGDARPISTRCSASEIAAGMKVAPIVKTIFRAQ